VTSPLATAIPVDGLPPGVSAWTTTRAAGSFGLGGADPVGDVMQRWMGLAHELEAQGCHRLASGHQVHATVVAHHEGSWTGWLRQWGVDGHMTTTPGTALAVTIADCTPVFIAHPDGAVAVLHAGWRGTAAGILPIGLDALDAAGFRASACSVHLGPSICGRCYEVGPEVLSAVRGGAASGKGRLDVRAVLAEQARARGVRSLTQSPLCTRCDGDALFSHRAGDAGRQLGIIAIRGVSA
jgi:YfiH family protein